MQLDLSVGHHQLHDISRIRQENSHSPEHTPTSLLIRLNTVIIITLLYFPARRTGLTLRCVHAVQCMTQLSFSTFIPPTSPMYPFPMSSRCDFHRSHRRPAQLLLIWEWSWSPSRNKPKMSCLWHKGYDDLYSGPERWEQLICSRAKWLTYK